MEKTKVKMKTTFLKEVKRKTGYSKTTEIDEALEEVDHNRNRKLDESEFAHFMEVIYEREVKVDNDDNQSWIKKVDNAGIQIKKEAKTSKKGIGFDVIGSMSCLKWGVWAGLTEIMLSDCRFITVQLGHLKDLRFGGSESTTPATFPTRNRDPGSACLLSPSPSPTRISFLSPPRPAPHHLSLPDSFSAKLYLDGCIGVTGGLAELKDIGLKELNLKGCVQVTGELKDLEKFQNSKKIVRVVLDECPLIIGDKNDVNSSLISDTIISTKDCTGIIVKTKEATPTELYIPAGMKRDELLKKADYVQETWTETGAGLVS